MFSLNNEHLAIDWHLVGVFGDYLAIKKAVQYIKENGRITNSDYQKINNVYERTALRDLEDLMLKKIVVKKEKRKEPIMNWFNGGYGGYVADILY